MQRLTRLFAVLMAILLLAAACSSDDPVDTATSDDDMADEEMADDDMAEILTEEYKNGAYPCVMHCFSSGADLAKAALDLGF